MKTILLVIVLVIISPVLMISQKQGQEKIDSLLNELPKAKEDTNKVNLLYNISFAYISINPDNGLEYASKCLDLSKKLNWKQGISAAYNSYGNYYWIKSNYLKALEYFSKNLSINLEIGNKLGVAKSLGNIGMIYHIRSDYPKSLEYNFKALKLHEELRNDRGIAILLGNIGVTYFEKSDYQKAKEYFLRALKIHDELEDKKGIASNLCQIGLIYFEQANHPKALEYFLKSQEICEELQDKQLAATNLSNIGTIYSNQNNNSKAIEYSFKALRILEELGDKSGIASNLGNIGKQYLKLSQDTNFAKIKERNEFVGLTKEINLRQGIKYSEQAAKISLEIEDLNLLRHIYQNLSEGYAQLGDYKLAYEYNEKHWKLKDSIFSFENQKKFKNLESARELEKKEAEIKIYQINDKFQKSAIWGASGLVLIVIFFLYVVWRQRRKSEKLLLNILPAKIATRLKKKEHPIADQFDEASVIFIDIVDFTKSSSNSDPKRVAEVLNTLYSKLDTLAKKHGLEKIKTIGDCYMAAAGIPIPDKENSIKVAAFATDAMTMLKDYNTGDGTILNFRCGLDCGPVVAGVIGENKFIYDLWGDTVNIASRMESNGVVGKIQVTERFKDKMNHPMTVSPRMTFQERGIIEIKGKGMMRTYFLESNNKEFL